MTKSCVLYLRAANQQQRANINLTCIHNKLEQEIHCTQRECYRKVHKGSFSVYSTAARFNYPALGTKTAGLKLTVISSN